MREIELTRGKVALVDDEDYENINRHKWNAHFNGFSWYARRGENGKQGGILKMHRVIMGVLDPNIKIDHKDGNGLNNQRDNLRIATVSQNGCNKKKTANTSSKYKGVYWDGVTKKWRVQVQLDGDVKRLGRFGDEIEAAKAYNEAAIKLHGEFARLNVIEQ